MGEKKACYLQRRCRWGSTPESLMLVVKFVTEAVVQVTVRRGTLRELIRLSPGILHRALFIPPGLSCLRLPLLQLLFVHCALIELYTI